MIIWGIGTQRWTRSARRIRSLQASAADVPVAMRVPVPWMFVFAYLVGLGLELVAAIRLPSPAAVLVYRLAGYVLVLAGMLAAFSSLWIFRRRQTTTVPFGTPSNLVTFGPYRFSRNPMYVGLTFLYVGIAGTRTDVWPLAILPLLLIYLQRIVSLSRKAACSRSLAARMSTIASACAAGSRTAEEAHALAVALSCRSRAPTSRVSLSSSKSTVLRVHKLSWQGFR
jgi:protein-S-isoprenylcysteine O-methyltransferase Ste14